MDEYWLDSNICPAHNDWKKLTQREKNLWDFGYRWGRMDYKTELMLYFEKLENNA